MTFMSEFRPPSYGPMNRSHYEVIDAENPQGGNDIEKPIFPINEIGQTIPETDPSGRFKTFIQQAQASIRMGAGNLQLAMNVPHTSAMGGRFKAYGKDVRDALREVAMANQVKVSGVELPTSSLTNMSGYDPQRNRFSDEVRKDHLDEVKDAIKFVAEACEGGGVDLISWEYERPINDATWNDPKKKLKDKIFQQPGEVEMVQVVDTKTGGVVGLQKNIVQHLAYDAPKDIKEVNYDKEQGWAIKKSEESKFEKGKPVLIKWDWAKFEESAELINKAAKKHNSEPGIKEADKWPEIAPETLFIQMQLEGQLRTASGYAGHYGGQAEKQQKIIQVLKPIYNNFDKLSEAQREQKLAENITKEGLQLGPQTVAQLKAIINNKKDLEETYKDHETDFEHLRSLAEGQMQQVEEIKERQKRYTGVSEYAVKKAVDSYAEAGIAAMQETHNKGKFLKDPIHVGPEIGWPQFYGSHPTEFVDMIMKSREEMVHKLTDPNSNFFQKGLSKQQAEEQAKTHIKGVFDTSHLAMWIRNFKPDLPWDTRVKEFNSWFTGQMEWLAKENKKNDILGAIQAVDSATGAHAHLPPGQGIFPIVEAVKILKEKGDFKGFLVSEGHEEEKFGEGRILLKAWEKFGGHFQNTGYAPQGGGQMTWGGIQNNYFGKTYSPMFMFGSYAPSNEFKLWSEIPFE